MADSAERTIAPTQARRDDARREGRVAHSHELAAAAVLIVGWLALSLLGEQVVERLARIMQRQLSGEAWSSDAFAGEATSRLDQSVAAGQSLLADVLGIVAPLLGIVVVVAIVASVIQTGFRWLPERVMPDVGRISPIGGLRRIFSLGGGQRLALGVLKIACLLGVGLASLWAQREAIVNAAALEPAPLAALIASMVYWTGLKLSLALLALAVADYGYQRWKLERDLQMTPEQLREELRNQQGDPQVLSRRQTLRRDLGVERLLAAVPAATLVLVEGEQTAVAIQYDPTSMETPIVAAKGIGETARRIRSRGFKHGVPIVEHAALAQSLYRRVGFNQPIAEELFDPVAKELARIYQLQGTSLVRRAA